LFRRLRGASSRRRRNANALPGPALQAAKWASHRGVADDRPHLAPREVRFALAGACDAAFSYAVTYQRVGFVPGDDEENATVESEFIVDDGRVPED
jgi:hypothetical protein